MATVQFAVADFGGSHQTLMSSSFSSSGAHTTSGTASNLTDGAAGAGSAITVRANEVLKIRCDGNIRVRIGGTATATEGIPVFANETEFLHCSTGGTVSVIDA